MGLFNRGRVKDFDVNSAGAIEDDLFMNEVASENNKKSLDKTSSKVKLYDFLVAQPDLLDVHYEYISGNFKDKVENLTATINSHIKMGNISDCDSKISYKDLNPKLFIASVEVLANTVNRITPDASNESELKDEVNNLNEQILIYRQENNDLKKTIIEKSNIINSFDNSGYISKISELEECISEQQATVDGLNAKIVQLKNDETVDELKAEIKSLTSMKDDSKKNFDLSLRIIKMFMSDEDFINGGFTNKTLEEVLEEIYNYSKNHSQLAKDYNGLVEEATTLVARIKHLEESDKNGEIEKLKSEINSLRNINHELDSSSKVKINNLITLNESLIKEKKSLIEQLENKEESVETDEDTLNRLDKMSELIAKKDLEIVDLTNSIEDYKEDILSLRKDIACVTSYTEVIPKYKTTIKTLNDKIRGYEDDIVDKVGIISKLSAELECKEAIDGLEVNNMHETIEYKENIDKLIDIGVFGYSIGRNKELFPNKSVRELMPIIIENYDSIDVDNIPDTLAELFNNIGEVVES